MKLAFLVPAPDFAQDWRWAFDAEAAALVASGIEVDPVPWTEARDLSGYDLVLPLVTWGYYERPGEWFAFLDRLERECLPVINPPSVLRWNSDKKYLAELGGKGVPTVPTVPVAALAERDLEEARRGFGTDRLIVKPPISAGAFDTFLLDRESKLPEAVRGRAMMIQPFVESIAEGEYSLILFDGALSHAVVKRPKRGDFRVQPHLGGETEVCDAPDGALEVAREALGAAPAEVTYARVDLVRDTAGQFRIIELELIEPALFLHLVPEAEARFAEAIKSAAQRASE